MLPAPPRLELAAACLLLSVGTRGQAQDIEPRTYSNAPVGVNFLIAGYAYTRGGVAFDSALPVTNPELKTSSAVLAYARALDLWGLSGKLDAIVPYTWLSGSADYAGQSLERVVNGFADPRIRLSINLYGAPALTLKEFKDYEQDLIVGASLQVSVPWGQYDDTRVVNIGTNRWFVKPELGVSKALGRWTLELSTAATLYTDNADFYGGNRRSQDPISTPPRCTRSTASTRASGPRSTPPISRAGEPRSTACRMTTCSRIGAWAGPLRFPLTASTRSSSTPAAGCRPARGTTTT
jgi:hypothetical protein